MSMPQRSFLSQVGKNYTGRITGFNIPDGADESHLNHAMIKRLRDIGFEEDRSVQVMHAGLFGTGPLAVIVGGITIALRRAEANLIQVELEAS